MPKAKPVAMPAPGQEAATEPRHPHPVIAAALETLGLERLPRDRQILHWLCGVDPFDRASLLAWTPEKSQAYAYLREQLPARSKKPESPQRKAA